MILPRIASREDAAGVATKIVDPMAVLFRLGDASAGTHEVRIGCSVGIAIFPTDAESPDGLMVLADAAMYHAKRNGSGFRFGGSGKPG